MRTKYLFFQLILLGLAITSPLHAWQVTVTTEAGEDEQVVVTNDRDLKGMDAYLVWVDKDAKRAEDVFQSWTVDKEWQAGLMPVTPEALELSHFPARKLAKLKQKCADKHRCFLAMVAVLHGKDPLDVSQWQATSILPLTTEAGRERLPGQQFFLPPQGATTGIEKATDGVTTTATVPPAAAPVAENVTTDRTTEKPDIFKLVDNQILYANGSAQRFQVIDLKDLTQPKLAGWMPLTGTPREVYSLGQTIVLLQTDYFSDTGSQTRLTSVRQVNGQLEKVDEVTLSGNFLQSRRRDDVIYAVSQQDGTGVSTPDCIDCAYIYKPTVQITALRLDGQGKLNIVDKAEISGYSPEIAIFPDHLVVANHDTQEWNSTNIQIFNLAVPNAALVKLPLLNVPGQVPSEFHLNVYNQQFRVVYGPTFNDKVGSSLAIYDLSKPTLDLLGKVSNIAPGEALFATRFTDNRAFVVTYQRTDPLWVIDVSNPQAPSILGELKVPGWSEKLFFNNNQLFAVGMHDQPEPNETAQWVRRVALSLFDVSDNNLSLLSRFIPLLDLGVTYSSSEALTDERALFLDWDNRFASLPIQSWETTDNSFLQLVSFQNNKIENIGRLVSPVPIQRSLPVDKQTLAALGDQEMLTLTWEMGNPNTQPVKILGSLELASNVSQVKKQGDNLWAVGQGNSGLHRLYRYTTQDITAPAQQWKLPQSYNNVVLNDKLAVFYNTNPIAIQVAELTSGKVRPAQRLEAVSTENDGKMTEWTNRSQWMLQGDKLYVAESRYITTPMPYQWKNGIAPTNYSDSYQSHTLLRSWNLLPDGAKEETARSIPGEPIGVAADGKYVITREISQQLRLNLLALNSDNARLVSSRELPCRSNSQAIWVDGAVYVTCIVNEPTDQTLVEMTTPILKLDPFSGQLAEGFAEIGRWNIKGYHSTISVTAEGIALIGNNYYSLYTRTMAMVDASLGTTHSKMAMPYYQPDCDIYQLAVGSQPTLLKHFDNCPISENTSAWNGTQAWIAKGFAGLEMLTW